MNLVDGERRGANVRICPLTNGALWGQIILVSHIVLS